MSSADVAFLKSQALRCRRLARQTVEDWAIEKLTAMANDFEAQAEVLDRSS